MISSLDSSVSTSSPTSTVRMGVLWRRVKITAFSRKITAVTITYVSGNTCTTSYEIDGNSAYVVVTHPTLGYLDGTFTLNWDGTFTVT